MLALLPRAHPCFPPSRVLRVAYHAAASGKISAQVGFHPSLQVGKYFFGETEEAISEAVACPTLLVPAGNDPDTVKPGGSLFNILAAKPFGDKCKTVECTCCFCR